MDIIEWVECNKCKRILTPSFIYCPICGIKTSPPIESENHRESIDKLEAIEPETIHKQEKTETIERNRCPKCKRIFTKSRQTCPFCKPAVFLEDIHSKTSAKLELGSANHTEQPKIISKPKPASIRDAVTNCPNCGRELFEFLDRCPICNTSLDPAKSQPKVNSESEQVYSYCTNPQNAEPDTTSKNYWLWSLGIGSMLIIIGVGFFVRDYTINAWLGFIFELLPYAALIYAFLFGILKYAAKIKFTWTQSIIGFFGTWAAVVLLLLLFVAGSGQA